MTFPEIDAVLAAHRRAALVAEADWARLRPARPGLRSHLAAALRRVAETLEPSVLPRPSRVA